MKPEASKFQLLACLEEAKRSVQPEAFRGRLPLRKLRHSAAIFWGKAAMETAETLQGDIMGPKLVITPVITRGRKGESPPKIGRDARVCIGEHPLPGPGSFEAGRALLEFFDHLRVREVRKLAIFLSGGASSLAWIPPASLPRERLLGELEALYALPLSIQELNRRRSVLCALKAGGAARWLERLAPQVRAEAFLISDVAPFGPEVVGSGPFFDGKIPHRILGDNPSWVNAFSEAARARGVPTLNRVDSWIAPWRKWLRRIEDETRLALRHGRAGLILVGGEPQVALPRHRGAGGRQSHLAASLALKFADELDRGRIEILCASSDGVDGTSGSSGAWLRSKTDAPSRLQSAVKRFDSAGALRTMGALLPSAPTGTNVQDLIAVWIRPKP